MSVELSIIVPAYNSAPYLEACINSIAMSTYQNYEIILIDDGSTDGTSEICEKLAQKYNKLIVFHTENQGICAARNLGIENATGKYIGFVDADDLISPIMFETLTSHMTDDVQMAACRFTRRKRTDVFVNVTALHMPEKTDTLGTAKKILLMGYGGYVWNKIFQKSIIIEHNIRFRHDNPVMEVL